MSRAVLTSINKPHTDKIFAIDTTERKTIEWRTKPLPKGKHYVYETKNKGGCGKVIGEIVVFDYLKFDSICDISDIAIRYGKVSREFLKSYAKGRPIYANYLSMAKRYDTPKELGEFRKPCADSYDPIYGSYCVDCDKRCRLTRPPQSWCYVEELSE